MTKVSANDKYLLIIVDDVNAVSVVDIDGPSVFVLQRGPHQQVSEAIVVEVWSSCHCITKPGILGLLFRLQSSIRYKHFLLREKKETGERMEGYDVTRNTSGFKKSKKQKKTCINVSLLRKIATQMKQEFDRCCAFGQLLHYDP